MSEIFFNEVNVQFPSATGMMIGYSDQEIEKIERLYGIVIAGDFRVFLRQAGRSDGGVIGDDPLIIYRSTWSVRTQILFRLEFFNSLQEIGAWDFLGKPFVFSLESESQYYFLQTGNADNDLVYHYDENERTVTSTGKRFSEYLISLLERYPLGGPVCVGELLNI